MRLTAALVMCLVLVPGCDGQTDSGPDEGAGSSQTNASPDGGAGGPDPGANTGNQGAGDGGAGATCEPASGTYEAAYAEQSGTCGPLDAPPRVPLDAGSAGVNTTIQRLASGDVTTEVVVRGCVLRVTQTVTNAQGAPVLQIDAEALSIDGDGVIRGSADVTRFDENRQVECTGVYDVELRSSSSILGSGASGDAGEPSGDTTLSADVQAKIQNDCTQTVQCAAQRAEPLPPNALSDCIEATTRQLSDDAARLTRFLAIVDRCESYVVCEYVDCALAGG